MTLLAGDICRLCNILSQKNADVNYKNKNNKTPLDLAVEKENQEVVELLKVITHHQ
jgi:ankyrin repeat protein